MSNEDLLPEVKQISYYRNKALSKMNIFKLEGDEIFSTWVNKFEYVAHMLKVPNNKMVEFFFTMVDNDVHKGVKHAFPSVNYSELDYEDIIYYYLRFSALSNETDLYKNRFLCRNQYENETIEKYADSLRKIYKKCNFTSHLEERLCEKFCNGIRDDNTRTHLSETPCLSFDETVAKAIEFDEVNNISDYLNPALAMIRVYNPEHEDFFYAWLNKFEYVTDSIGVPDKKKIKFFNEMVDIDFHTDIKKIFFGVEFSELSYEDLITYYLHFFDTSYDNDLHKKRFLCRNQYEQETIQNYADSLRKIYNKCSFANNQQVILREKFRKGIRDNNIRTYLSKTPCLSFVEMVAKAIEFEEVNISDYLIPALSMINIYYLEPGIVFYRWLNKFEYVSDAVGVPDKKKIKFFNEMVDNEVHTIVKQNYFKLNFSELSYEDLITYYLHFFDTSYENDLHKDRFLCRDQYEKETIENYAASLQKIYNKCNYASNQQEVLCEKFRKGIRDNNIRTYLSKTPCLSFDEMVAKAIEFDEVNNISDYLYPALAMIRVYNREHEDVFYAWLNRFEYVADAVGLPDKKKIKFFNEMVDNDLHTSVKQTFLSVKFSELSYDDIINYYLRFFDTSHENDLHEKRFLCRNQYEQETIKKYADNLRKIYNKCNCTSDLEERLDEKFRNGIRNVYIRTHLIKTPGLSFEEALVVAIALEKVLDVPQSK